MSKFSVYREADNGYTYVSNQFIDDYLADANAAQIKVYLYLMRMTGNTTSVSDMADKFNYTEKDICRALKYWEKFGLLSLNYDLDGAVVGVKLNTPYKTATISEMSSKPFIPVALPYVSGTDHVSAAPKAAREVQNPVTEEHPTNEFVKPAYSLDDLKAFKDQEDTAQIIFIAEQYLGKTLSPSDIKSLLFITDVLHFSTDLIDYLLAYCVNKDKKSFRYIESVAINWAQEGITTPEEAKATSGRYDKSVYSVMRALGKSSSPTDKEADYVRRWTNDFGFSSDIILEACERSVMSTDKNRFAYADSILKSWSQAGVVNKTDIDEIDAKYHRPKKTANTSFHQFDMKHDYDYDEMEKALLSRE
ncbi:MAG: DnaD domain protein [Lachnospiraceae bacterium]|nr:DnaD domain protein [Lachnospiraceae bacterium]